MAKAIPPPGTVSRLPQSIFYMENENERDVVAMTRADAPNVWIRCETDAEYGTVYICGDEDGEFARATSSAQILRYVEDLIIGPGTRREGGLREASTITEEQP